MQKNIKLGTKVKTKSKYYYPEPFSGILIARTIGCFILTFDEDKIFIDNFKINILNSNDICAIKNGWNHAPKLENYLGKKYKTFYFYNDNIEECIQQIDDINLKCRKIK